MVDEEIIHAALDFKYRDGDLAEFFKNFVKYEGKDGDICGVKIFCKKNKIQLNENLCDDWNYPCSLCLKKIANEIISNFGIQYK